MIALFVSVGLWRQQLPTHTRVHGIIQEGGTAANIIPDRTKAWFMLRSADQAYYETMKRRFIAMCEAAASASDVEVEVEFSGGATTMNHNVALAQRWVENAEAAGVIDQGMDPASGSTDMANVSWVVPTIHPELSITDRPHPRPYDRVPRRSRAADRRSDHAPRRDARRADRDRPPVRPGAGRGRVDRVQGVDRRLTAIGCHRRAPRGVRCPGAPRWTADPNRRRAG